MASGRKGRWGFVVGVVEERNDRGRSEVLGTRREEDR